MGENAAATVTEPVTESAITSVIARLRFPIKLPLGRSHVARILIVACAMIGVGDLAFLHHVLPTRPQQVAVTKSAPAEVATTTSASVATKTELAAVESKPEAVQIQTAPTPAPESAEAAPIDPAVKIAQDLADARPTILDLALAGEETDRLALMRRAGVDLEKLLRRFGGNTDVGGPFVPPSAIRTAPFDPQRLAELQRVFKSMPFAAPLASFKVDSGFGPRRDPFNGGHAFHAGIDLGESFGATVYSTAPGRVTFAGQRDAYGRMIEIDHGNGIVTRYAHLSRIVVGVGQRVEAHHAIGAIGSTGRSTGPHLHYEVLVDGRPQDPAKFLPSTGDAMQRVSAFSGR